MSLIEGMLMWGRLAKALGYKMGGPRRYRRVGEITAVLKRAYRSPSEREAILSGLSAENGGQSPLQPPSVVQVEEVVSYPPDPATEAMAALPTDFTSGAQPREFPRSGRGKVLVSLQYTGPDDSLSREMLGNIAKGELHTGRLADLKIVTLPELLEFLIERLGQDNLLTEQIRASALFGFVRSGPGWYMSTRVEIN